MPVAGAMTAAGVPRKVVYVPSCVTRMMGPAASDYETESVHEKLMSLFNKAGYEVGCGCECVSAGVSIALCWQDRTTETADGYLGCWLLCQYGSCKFSA